ncbi:hypothetical protein MSG28_006106, partial [Choristoneura fumiferana]
PQKHHPRIDFPTRFLSSGETLRANCTTAPALPAPHITWFINGKKSERNGRRARTDREPSTPPPLLALTQASHFGELHEPSVVHASSRHRSRRPRDRDLYVTVSELQLVATGRLEITCVSTIPEFRSIHDKFADLRNDTVI